MHRYGYTHVNKMHKTLVGRNEMYLRNHYFWGTLRVMSWGEVEDFA